MGFGFIIYKSINLQFTNLQFTIESCNAEMNVVFSRPIILNCKCILFDL